MSQLEAMQRIDRFIKKMDDRDIVFVPEKSNARYGLSKIGFLGREKKEDMGTLSDNLSRHLAIYQQAKDLFSNSMFKMQAISNALEWINRAETSGAVKPSDGLFGRYEDCLLQIQKLTKEKKGLEDELQQVGADLLESEAERKSLKYQLDELRNK